MWSISQHKEPCNFYCMALYLLYLENPRLSRGFKGAYSYKSWKNNSFCGNDTNAFCDFSCRFALKCSMVTQIFARRAAILIAFVIERQVYHDFAFGIDINPCVIEITIGNTIWYLQFHFECDKLCTSFTFLWPPFDYFLQLVAANLL